MVSEPKTRPRGSVIWLQKGPDEGPDLRLLDRVQWASKVHVVWRPPGTEKVAWTNRESVEGETTVMGARSNQSPRGSIVRVWRRSERMNDPGQPRTVIDGRAMGALHRRPLPEEA